MCICFQISGDFLTENWESDCKWTMCLPRMEGVKWCFSLTNLKWKVTTKCLRKKWKYRKSRENSDSFAPVDIFPLNSDIFRVKRIWWEKREGIPLYRLNTRRGFNSNSLSSIALFQMPFHCGQKNDEEEAGEECIITNSPTRSQIYLVRDHDLTFSPNNDSFLQ